MTCKICQPPGQAVCPECQREIDAKVEEIVQRVRGLRRIVATAEVLRVERRANVGN